MWTFPDVAERLRILKQKEVELSAAEDCLKDGQLKKETSELQQEITRLHLELTKAIKEVSAYDCLCQSYCNR